MKLVTPIWNCYRTTVQDANALFIKAVQWCRANTCRVCNSYPGLSARIHRLRQR